MASEHQRAAAIDEAVAEDERRQVWSCDVAEGIHANMPTAAVEIIAADAPWDVLQRTDERYRAARDARRDALRQAGVTDG